MMRAGLRPILRAIRLAVVPLLLLSATASLAQDRRTPTVNELGAALSRYYEKPVDIPTLLAELEKSGVGVDARDRVMGFLAGLFVKDPGQIKIVTATTTFGRQTQAVVIQGLRLAGRHADALAAAKAWGWPPDQMAPITPVTPLRQAKVSHPSSFDVMWAASFATGDAAYVRPIYDYYESVATLPSVDVRDMVALVMLRHKPDKDAMEALKNKYPQDTFMRIVFASSALWSLESNARQHKFVATALSGYQKEKPGSPAATGLAEMRKAAEAALGNRR